MCTIAAISIKNKRINKIKETPCVNQLTHRMNDVPFKLDGHIGEERCRDKEDGYDGCCAMVGFGGWRLMCDVATPQHFREILLTNTFVRTHILNSTRMGLTNYS